MAEALLNEGNAPQYKATQLWRQMIHGFRTGMPVSKHRVRMKVIEDSFTGADATEWLKQHLEMSGLFQTIDKQQVLKLLQKFLESGVIEDAKGKDRRTFEDGSHLYRFVTSPNPLNFIEEEEEEEVDEKDSSVLCIANSYALIGGEQDTSLIEIEPSTDAMMSEDECPSHVAAVWKEFTLAKLLKIIEMPNLDCILSYDAVDGKIISYNIIKSLQQLETAERDAVDDVPSWVIMAIKCISKWPKECPEGLTGGLPVYHGFEQDILQSLITYFSSLPQPLISSKLYDLYMTIYPLIETNSLKATDALQLCCLFLPHTNRIRLHRVMRMIHKASHNTQLQLSLARHNQHVLLEQFSPLILRPLNGLLTDEQTGKRLRLINHMADNYRHIFRIPVDLRHEVEQELNRLQMGQLELPVITGFCKRVSVEQYEEQKRATSQGHLIDLLGTIVRDENMTSKMKKQKLKQFQKSYPELYIQHFPGPPAAKRNRARSS